MMKADLRKVVLIGTGMVGMSYAYALVNQAVCNELVLIDLDQKRAQGEAMDLNHGLAFAPANMKIYAGDYSDCKDADLAVISAGVAQKPGESRLDLLSRNAAVFRTIMEPLRQSGFGGIIVVATNPVDIMTHIAHKLSVLTARGYWEREPRWIRQGFAIYWGNIFRSIPAICTPTLWGNTATVNLCPGLRPCWQPKRYWIFAAAPTGGFA